jgi:hypothetical protein
VDDAPTSRDTKERTWQALMQIMPMIREQGIPVPPEVIEYAPLPSALIAKWKPMLQQAQQKAQTANPAKEQLELEGQLSQIRVQEASQIEEAKAGTEIKKVQLQAEAKGIEAQADAQAEMVRGQAQIQIEREKMALELERKKEELQAEYLFKVKEKQMELDASMQEKLIEAAAQVMAAKVSANHSNSVETEDETAPEGNNADLSILIEEIRNLAEQMSRPKTIIRGPDGRVAGVQ